MARNSITDVTDLLIAQMEALSEEGMTAEQVEIESKKAKSMVAIAGAIVEAGKLQIDFIKATESANPSAPLFKNVTQQLQ